MEEIVLKNYETFDEIPNGLLQVKENSNLMYVRIGKNSFIAREFIDSIEFEDEYIKYQTKGSTIYSAITLFISLISGFMFNINPYIPMIICLIICFINIIF